MKNFTHIHSSTLYSRSLATLERAIDAYIQEADLVTFTEVASEPREEKLREVEKWGVQVGDLTNRDECGIIWDRKVWKRVDGGTQIVLPSMFFLTGGKLVEPGAAVWAVLEHRDTGRKLLVVVFHFPSSVEEKGVWSRLTRRVKAWNVAHSNLRTMWNIKAKAYKVDGILMCADWNVDIKKSSWRTLIKKLQPGMVLVWGEGPFPRGGTHGSRLIDFSFIRGQLKAAGLPSLMPDDDSSDHRPYKETLAWLDRVLPNR